MAMPVGAKRGGRPGGRMDRGWLLRRPSALLYFAEIKDAARGMLGLPKFATSRQTISQAPSRSEPAARCRVGRDGGAEARAPSATTGRRLRSTAAGRGIGRLRRLPVVLTYEDAEPGRHQRARPATTRSASARPTASRALPRCCSIASASATSPCAMCRPSVSEPGKLGTIPARHDIPRAGCSRVDMRARRADPAGMTLPSC